MRRACPLLVAIAACRFVPVAATADGGASGAQVVDDTAADFAAGSADGLAVDPLGLLVPEAYAAGLHARAYATAIVDPTTALDDVEATLATMTPAGEAYGVMPQDWSLDRPHGLGLSSSDQFTLAFDGELYLPAGATTIQLDCDDDGLLEIDLGAIRPVVRAHVNDSPADAITVTPPQAGWYPVRGVMSEQYAYATYVISLGRGTVPMPAGADVLRTRITAAQGLVVTGAADRLLASPAAATSVETTLARDFGDATPPGYDLGLPGQDFSLRFAGQLRIDAAGMYTFAVDTGADTDDYARIVVDGAAVASTWPGQLVPPAPVQLAAGWHDLVVDYADATGAATLHATMAAAGGAPAPLGGAELRPVRATGLVTGATQASPSSWNTPGGTSVNLTLAAPPGANVDALDAYFQLSPRAHVQPTVLSPAGTSDPLALPAIPAYGGTSDAFAGRTALAGAAVGGAWQLAFTDGAADGTVQVQAAALVASYHGGPGGPYPTAMTYVSASHPTPGARSIDAVHVLADLHGASLAIDVRTGDAQTIDAAPWVPVPGSGAPAVAPGALVEYRLTLTGDGWQAPAIDRVEIDYTTGGQP